MSDNTPTPPAMYDWSKAPPWARWAATDSDGRVHWYEAQPFIGEVSYEWLPYFGTRCSEEIANFGYSGWRDSLQERPEGTP